MYFGYRGVLLDESRHFYGRAFVYELLDLMSKLRYNRLHWHLSDDQGFRLALPDYPKLEAISSKRSYTEEGYFLGKKKRIEEVVQGSYKPEEIQALVSYAEGHGIEVIPEIDMPGHLGALLAAYSEFTHDGKAFEVPGSFGVLHHTLCLGNEEAVSFMKGLVGEVADLFGCRHFHLGFDEIPLAEIKSCPHCQAKMKELGLAKPEDLIGWFKNEMVSCLLKKKIQPIVYDDGLTKVNPSVVVEFWSPRSQKRMIRLVNQGQKVIVAPFFRTYANQPYCLVPLRKTYAYEPCPKGILHPENILGGEICYWTEFTKTTDKFHFEFDYRSYAVSKTLLGQKAATYGEFLKDLHDHEEYIYGKKAPIPDKIVNPSFLRRLIVFRRYAHQSTDYEYRAYLKIKD
jgi:hexosaminidase